MPCAAGLSTCHMTIAHSFMAHLSNLMFVGSSSRSFLREFRRVVEVSDVVLEVLDARDPLSSRCPDLEKYIRAQKSSKKIVLLLNKIGKPLME